MYLSSDGLVRRWWNAKVVVNDHARTSDGPKMQQASDALSTMYTTASSNPSSTDECIHQIQSSAPFGCVVSGIGRSYTKTLPTCRPLTHVHTTSLAIDPYPYSYPCIHCHTRI